MGNYFKIESMFSSLWRYKVISGNMCVIRTDRRLPKSTVFKRGICHITKVFCSGKRKRPE